MSEQEYRPRHADFLPAPQTAEAIPTVSETAHDVPVLSELPEQITSVETEAPMPTPDVVARRSIRGFIRARKQRHAEVADSAVSAHEEAVITTEPASVFSEVAPEEPESEQYRSLSDLLKPEVLREREQAISARIDGSPVFSKLRELNSAARLNSEEYSKASRTRDLEKLGQLDRENIEILEAEEAFSIEQRGAYRSLSGQLYDLNMFQSYDVGSGEQTGQALLEILREAPAVHNRSAEASAPFAHHEENDGSSRKVVTTPEIESYLEDRLPMKGYLPTEAGSVMIRGSREEGFDVPLDLVVKLAGFETWLGRSAQYGKDYNSEFGAGKMSSLNVIKHYASLATEVPPVTVMRVLIQPDGKILCDNGEGDSHRIAAAMLRGDTTVKATNLEFKLLKYNVI